MLSFPIDVANADRASGNHGHYIMFEINEQIGSKLNWGSRAAEKVSGELEALKEDSKRKLKAATENQIVEDVKSSHIDYKKAFAKTSKELKKIGVGGIAGTKSTVYIDRPPTKKLDTVITLFMPPGIKTKYKAINRYINR